MLSQTFLGVEYSPHYLDEEWPFAMGGLLVMWFVIYYAVTLIPLNDKHLNKIDYLDLRNRITSLLHGVFSLCCCGFYYLHMTGEQCGADNKLIERRMVMVSGAYFLYDFLIMAFYGLLDVEMTIHHLACTGGITWSIYANTTANYIVMGLLIAEISNPAMHSRIIIRHLGMRYTRLYEVLEIFYLMIYMFARTVVGIPIVYDTFQCKENPLPISLVSLAILL